MTRDNEDPTDLQILGSRPEQTPTRGLDTEHARLVCLVGEELGQVFKLGKKALLIGRSEEADIRLNGNDISRLHAAIEPKSGGFVIRDLQSRHGTSVNGVPIQRHELAFGDRIHIAASAVLVFARHDELEARAQRLQQLEALGQLAGELAHDFNNILAAVIGNIDLLLVRTRKKYPDDDELREGLEDIQGAAESASNLIRKLLDFSRRRPAHGAAPFELAPLVREVTDLVRRTLEQPIEIDVDVAPDLEVRGDRGELHQVLLNLYLNARDAMPDGGRISVRATRRRLPRLNALALHLQNEGTYVELEVSDDGKGMDEKTLARAFEPFFTTKKEGKGTGLGLAAVYGIIRSHGGNVFAESTPGNGTTFSILLPAEGPEEDREPTEQIEQREPATSSGTG